MFEKIIKLLNDANNISIYSHVNTDCDAMGSSLALKLALKQLGKNVDVYSNSDFPTNFKFYGEHIDELNKKTCENALQSFFGSLTPLGSIPLLQERHGCVDQLCILCILNSLLLMEKE